MFDKSGSGTFNVDYDGRTVTLKKGEYYTQSKLKSLFKISDKDWDKENDMLKDALSNSPITPTTREKKEMPDSYWDY